MSDETANRTDSEKIEAAANGCPLCGCRLYREHGPCAGIDPSDLQSVADWLLVLADEEGDKAREHTLLAAAWIVADKAAHDRR